MRQYWNIAVGALCAVLIIGAIITCSTIVLRGESDVDKETTEAPRSILGGIGKGNELQELRDQLDEARKVIEELEAKLKKGPEA